MGYDAAQAVGFAEDFWNRPCRSASHPGGALGLSEAHDVSVDRFWDKKKAPPDKFELRFVYNDKKDRDDLLAVPKPGAGKLDAVPVVDGEKLEDCAYFLSECLIAGGLRIKEQWSVPMLLMALRESPVPKTLAEKVSRDVAQAIIDTGLLKPVPDNAETHRSPLANKLAGWWKVEQKSATLFLFVAPDGTAVQTTTAPKDGRTPTIGRSDSPGYWFASAIEAKFCFRTDGSVMTIKVLQNGQSQADVFIVRSGPAKATRLSFDPPKSR
jgi:hypothetical protein